MSIRPFRNVAGWILIAVALNTIALPVVATIQGQITGTVSDSNGEPLVGVLVVVESTTLDGLRSSVLTNEAGRFQLSDLPVGNYMITFSLEGFSNQVVREYTVGLGEASRLDVVMNGHGAMGDLTLEEIVVMGARASSPSSQIRFRGNTIGQGKSVAGKRPIPLLGQASYAFNAPPGLRYLEEVELLFRVDPSRDIFEIREDIEELGLRGSIETATGLWSRCMAAELVETTIDPLLRARPVEDARLHISPLAWDSKLQQWGQAESTAHAVVHKLGLHPTDWKWRIKGIRAGRTQLALRLYAVAVLEDSAPGQPECTPAETRAPADSRRVRTFQRSLMIEVSAESWIEARLPSPMLWSLLLLPTGLLMVWWRRVRARPIPEILKSGRKD